MTGAEAKAQLRDLSAWRKAAVATAAVAGLVSLFVAVVMISFSLRSRAADIRDADALAKLKFALREDPANDDLRQKIRALDLRLRQSYFSRTRLMLTGRYLLVVGLVVFAASAKVARELGKRPPMPTGAPEPTGPDAPAWRRARRIVATTAAGLLVVAAGLVAGTTTPLVQRKAPSAPPWPSAEEMAANWPRFRGPGGLGLVRQGNYPLAWDCKTGKGVVWKSEIPLPAPSSPVVWSERLFLTGSDKKHYEVFCYDTRSGRLLWRKDPRPIPGSPARFPEVMEAVGYAAPTPVTDGRRVYALFATGDIAAFDFQGRRAWARNLGVPDNSYGHASSLLLWRDRLIVPYDQAAPDDHKSKLIALDTRTGQTVWETPRESPQTWMTPIVAPTPSGEQIICCSDPFVSAYEVATGKEVWRAEVLGGEIAPSPVCVDGVAYVANSGSYAAAIRTDGKGNVTETHILWKGEEGLPETCSPVTDGKLLFLLDNTGILTCYDAKTGEKVWDAELEMPCSASPTIVGDRLYVFTEKGVAVVVAVARKFKELARSPIGEPVRATPAFVGGKIYVRGKKHLFCIGAK